MKILELLIVFSLFLFSALSVPGQNASFPNEIKGYELYGNGRLENIKILVSNQTDVIKTFGKKYGKVNDYDDNWTVSFTFFRQGEYISEGTGRSERKFYLPKKYIGKLSEIHFLPKKHISFEKIQFSNLFEQSFGNQTGDASHPDDESSMNTFVVSFNLTRLKYVICSSTSVSGRYQNGDVFSIDYETDRDEIFGIHEYYELKNKKKTRQQSRIYI